MSREGRTLGPDDWQRYPRPLEFGSVYLCADAQGVPFKRMLTAGDPRDTPYWAQVAWVLSAGLIPKPPVPRG